MATQGNHEYHRLSRAGLLITLGIIYGDIGTSPLYVMKAIVGEGSVIDRVPMDAFARGMATRSDEI